MNVIFIHLLQVHDFDCLQLSEKEHWTSLLVTIFVAEKEFIT